MRIPTLTRENYNTWKLRMWALITKNKRGYISEDKPAPREDDALRTWQEEDKKTKADLYLAIGDTELK